MPQVERCGLRRERSRREGAPRDGGGVRPAEYGGTAAILSPARSASNHEQLLDQYPSRDEMLFDHVLDQRLESGSIGFHPVGPRIAAEHVVRSASRSFISASARSLE